ncbi:uncharacterized protein CPUR_07567 [Claviceps purpurea 20.1]|uniref:Uncharacterized protein n=1 Tax=Claviceps purpurea (strain 20.1) TaxID=1111077 RepID=M1W4P3_CLAP2|nr:uncharacterized protein CPUR_07567 [Claviceps purpurea 20.1]
MRSYYDAGHLAGIAQQALLQMDSMSLGDRIIKTEPEEDSPMSGMSPCGPSNTDAYFAPGSSIIKAEPEEDSPMSGIPPWKPSHTDAYFALRPSIIKAEPEEDSPMSGLNGLPPTNPSNPPEFGPGGGGFHANHWEDWLSRHQRNYPRKQPVQQQHTSSDDDDDDEDPLAGWLSLAAAPDPFPRDIKVEEEARVIEVFGNTLSAWGLPASQYNMGYEYSWPSTPRGLSEPVFYGTVHEEHSYEATERAREIHGAGSSLSHVVMWTGASAPRRTHDGVGYAVASLFNGEGWRVMCRREGHSIGRLWMSLQSIALAIEVALQHVTLWQPTPFVGTTVRIFTSDTAAIKALKTLPLCAMNMSMTEASQTISVLEEIAAMSRYLSELGATLEVFWAPRAKHPGYRVAREASVYARSTPDGRSQESWAFPDKGVVVEALEEDASANIKAELEERVKTEVKAEFKVEIKAQVKDDDDDMSSLDLKTEKDFEVESKWWQRLSCC